MEMILLRKGLWIPGSRHYIPGIFFEDNSHDQSFDTRNPKQGDAIENTSLMVGIFAIVFDRFRFWCWNQIFKAARWLTPAFTVNISNHKICWFPLTILYKVGLDRRARFWVFKVSIKLKPIHIDFWYQTNRTYLYNFDFTDDKLNFIINYDIKYRMGRVTDGVEEAAEW